MLFAISTSVFSTPSLSSQLASSSTGWMELHGGALFQQSLVTGLLIGQGEAGSFLAGLQSFVPIILIFAVFYFVVYYPMTKQDRERRTRLDSLKAGDEVVLNGGILGKIHAVGDDGIVEVEISNRSRVRVIRKEISDLYSAYKSRNDDGAQKAPAKAAKPDDSSKSTGATT